MAKHLWKRWNFRQRISSYIQRVSVGYLVDGIPVGLASWRSGSLASVYLPGETSRTGLWLCVRLPFGVRCGSRVPCSVALAAAASHTLCRRSFFVQFRQVVNGGEKGSHLGPLVSTSVLSNCSGEMPVLTTVVTDVAGEADRLCCESYASQVLLNLGTRGYPGCASACSFCRSFPGSGRLRRRIVRTLDAFSPRSYDVATLPEILPPVTMS